MPTVKIARYQLSFTSELSSATSASVVKKLKASGDEVVNHRIRGYYERPVSSADITVRFDCAHPDDGPARYANDSGPPIRRWEEEFVIAGPIRSASATTKLHPLVAAAPPRPVGAVIDCVFEVEKRWSRELSDWLPVLPGYSATCALTYKVEP